MLRRRVGVLGILELEPGHLGLAFEVARQRVHEERLGALEVARPRDRNPEERGRDEPLERPCAGEVADRALVAFEIFERAAELTALLELLRDDRPELRIFR